MFAIFFFFFFKYCIVAKRTKIWNLSRKLKKSFISVISIFPIADEIHGVDFSWYFQGKWCRKMCEWHRFKYNKKNCTLKIILKVTHKKISRKMRKDMTLVFEKYTRRTVKVYRVDTKIPLQKRWCIHVLCELSKILWNTGFLKRLQQKIGSKEVYT